MDVFATAEQQAGQRMDLPVILKTDGETLKARAFQSMEYQSP
jgi:hypothetical protein